MHIAIDVMGGDHAPAEIVKGAVDAARRSPEVKLFLVGREEDIVRELGDAKSLPNITIRHASQVVEMDEEPVAGLRRKTDSSLRVALRLVHNGEADAIISAGNTGALVGGAQLGLGMLEGVKRPGIAIPIPTANNFAAIIDVGANPNCRVINLLQYGVMGSIYTKFLKEGISEPTIGLLNIGEEVNKGNPILKEAHAVFKKSKLNFIGNVEPHHIFKGHIDVVVTDGFVGNLMLKMAEGFGTFLMDQVANGLAPTPDIRTGLGKIFQRLDYTTYGGAPVLGVRGIVFKCHGRSKGPAISKAVDVTAGFIKRRLNDHIVDGIKKMSLWSRLSDWWTTKKDGQDF